MPKCLNLAVAAAGACLIVGCATQSKSNLSGVRHVPNVRTTAYTHSEGSGSHNAVGTHLSGQHVMSAASDWSRYPLGTRFRISSTSEEYIIDDYGWALVGTDTIDLYKPSRLEMKRWGVRRAANIVAYGKWSPLLRRKREKRPWHKPPRLAVRFDLMLIAPHFSGA
jgi:3D (Asp-Asp-Asp) domain-containing protein